MTVRLAPVASAPASKQWPTRWQQLLEILEGAGTGHPRSFGVRGDDVGRVAAVRDDPVDLVERPEVLAQQADRDLGDGERVGGVDCRARARSPRATRGPVYCTRMCATALTRG